MAISNGFIISLSPSHLSAIAVRRGRVQQAETIRLDPNEWRAHWTDGLMRLDQPLRQILSRFSSISRSGVTLLYQSPTLTTQVNAIDQGGAFAREKARSKIREVVGIDASVCVCELGQQQGGDEKGLVLAYSDRDETLRAFYAWLNRCGARVSGMIPSGVVSMLVSTEHAVQEPGDTAFYYLDKHSSVISYADREQGLRLVRPADIGYEALTDTYKQVLRELDENDDSEIDRSIDAEARAHLFEHGIPFQPKQLEKFELRSSLLPRMAPVLQRIGIDLKQTIRFGIADPMAVENLVVLGPGGAIPMITKAIGEHLDLTISTDAECDHYDSTSPGSPSSTENALIGMKSSIPSLLPRIADEERSRSQLKKAMVAGVACAGFAMAGQYMLAQRQIIQTEQGMLESNTRFDQIMAFEETSSTINETQAMLSQIAMLVHARASESAQWEVPLAVLGNSLDEGVRIQEIRGEYNGGSPHLKINGYSIGAAGKSPGQVLDQFVLSLGAIQHVQEVQLGATSRIQVPSNSLSPQDESVWGSQFSLVVELDTHASPYAEMAEVEAMSDWTQP
jgi:hypothetical protein